VWSRIRTGEDLVGLEVLLFEDHLLGPLHLLLVLELPIELNLRNILI